MCGSSLRGSREEIPVPCGSGFTSLWVLLLKGLTVALCTLSTLPRQRNGKIGPDLRAFQRCSSQVMLLRRALLGNQRKGATSLKRTDTVLGSSSLLGLPIAIAGSRKIHLPNLSGLECLPCEPAGGLAAFPLPFACRSCPLLHPPAFFFLYTSSPSPCTEPICLSPIASLCPRALAVLSLCCHHLDGLVFFQCHPGTLTFLVERDRIPSRTANKNGRCWQILPRDLWV